MFDKLKDWVTNLVSAFWTRLKGDGGFRSVLLKVVVFLLGLVVVTKLWGFAPAVYAYVLGAAVATVLVGLVPKFDFKLVKKK